MGYGSPSFVSIHTTQIDATKNASHTASAHPSVSSIHEVHRMTSWWMPDNGLTSARAAAP